MVRGEVKYPSNQNLFGNSALAMILPPRSAVRRPPYTKTTPLTDVTACVKSWGRRGVIGGAVFGFVLGIILVAIPLSTNILTFGVGGTLLVAVVECAVIAGGFAALAAALFGQGSGGHARSDALAMTRRRTTEAAWRDSDSPLAEWPQRKPSTFSTPPPPFPLDSDGDWNTVTSLQNIQTRLNTIDAWENGNTGP
jgi:hypothetical protein